MGAPGSDGDLGSINPLTLASPRDAFHRFVAKGSEPPMYAHWQVFFGHEIKPFETASCRDDGGLYLQQLIDDRIPSMSFIGVDNPGEIHQDDLDRLPAFDVPGLDYEPAFRGRLRDSFQYTRFRHWGTTYYCNGTSFAVLHGIGDFSDVLLTHYRRHYTHFGVIAHFQHAALLYFADELAETVKDLAAQPGGDDYSNPAWAEPAIRTLPARLKFRTRSYFTEVSNQIQGKDLFQLWYRTTGNERFSPRLGHQRRGLRSPGKPRDEGASESSNQTRWRIHRDREGSNRASPGIQATDGEPDPACRDSDELVAYCHVRLGILHTPERCRRGILVRAGSFGRPALSEALAWLLVGVVIGGILDTILLFIYLKRPKGPQSTADTK